MGVQAPPRRLSRFRDQIQTSLGSGYTLERELGGGGKSRVFVIDEIRLRRKLVVKVLSLSSCTPQKPEVSHVVRGELPRIRE